ncbi:nickel-dependent hydrogenase large subunit [Anaeromyxobacter oryzae]|uniref:Periplasmic [NiFeSe] hydrogenase large subunit n=1 Tax=Anaeromyxobacter oryzae TaxID=2918170 RepID=A0ABM7WX40_9BACT|nr:nickel-dependent hydrogenase large subunit [Anaeromyxobacter oryzae]BDG04050.1 periplasmic [NiFeSe] hydrogenase large subunit [Anaeromyxobacter oryzae]
MSRRITVAPVTRVEGHLSLNVDIDDTGRVIAAYASGTMFRGFESIIAGRDPRDAIHLTQRICGVCPIPHARAAVEVVERAFGVEVSRNALLLRNLVQGAGLVSDHLLHFYHLALLDYVHGPALPPFTPAIPVDQRFSEADAQVFAQHYLAALDMRRKAQEMGAIFAGKLPHVMTFAPGGVTQQPTSANVRDFGAYLDQLVPFVENVYIPDVMKVAQAYPEYLEIGGGPVNLLSFGAFPDGTGGQLFPAGKYGSPGRSGAHSVESPRHVSPLTDADVASIGESVKHAYYGDGRGRNADTVTPNLDKRGAYSWVKAPRLGDEVFQVGALARMIVSGNYRGGLSAMDRLLANAYETGLVAGAMRGWLGGLSLDTSGYQHVATMPKAGRGVALTEAPRGALAHWLEYADGKVTGYRIITPTSWNASPRDDREAPGPLEQALVGVRVADKSQPVEVYRVIHSFDPCMGCAVHVTVI